MSGQRVVVTGLGCCSPLGATAGENWESMVAGRNGIGPITTTPLYDLKIRHGGEIAFDVTGGIDPKRLLMLDRFSVLAIHAAREALAQSGLEIDGKLAGRIGAVVGVGIFGSNANEASYRKVLEEKARRTHIFTVPKVMPSAAASQVAMEFGLKGPSFGVTSACASSNHAYFSALQLIRSGAADVVVCGGAEAPIVFGVLKAWEALRIVSPDLCRPFSAERRGLVLAEGAGIAILESEAHARARGAPILAELAGAGISSDAGDLVLPSQEGQEAAMRLCLADAGMAAAEVDYINAHGTGTKMNDIVETRAIRGVLGAHANRIAVSSTKSMHGHALGAAGAVELVACIQAIRDNMVPPTINFGSADPECDLDVTPNTAGARPVNAVLSNSFAFGGLNAVIAVRRYDR